MGMAWSWRRRLFLGHKPLGPLISGRDTFENSVQALIVQTKLKGKWRRAREPGRTFLMYEVTGSAKTIYGNKVLASTATNKAFQGL